MYLSFLHNLNDPLSVIVAYLLVSLRAFSAIFETRPSHVTKKSISLVFRHWSTLRCTPMLSSLRTRIPRSIPRYSRSVVTEGPNNPEQDTEDPYNVFETLAGPDARADAVPIAQPPDSSPTVQANSTDVAIPSAQISSNIMIIPPAQDPLLHYLTSKLTHDGLRTRAAGRVTRVLMHIHGYTRAQPLPILRQAIFAASPAVRVMNHKKGSKSIGVPMALNEKQRTRFGVEWIINASQKKAGKSLEVRLAKEMISVVQGSSEALKKKEEVHRSAMLNRCVVVSFN